MSYCLVVRITAREGEEERVAAAYASLEEASRAEPGVIDWRVFRSAANPREFLLYELYHDASGLDAHRATEHFQRYLTEIVPLLETREPTAWEPLTE